MDLSFGAYLRCTHKKESAMTIGSVGTAAVSPILPKVPEAVEAPGKDHDNDGDNGVSAAKSSTAAGVGSAIDKTA
jgi:hypothetical protein